MLQQFAVITGAQLNSAKSSVENMFIFTKETRGANLSSGFAQVVELDGNGLDDGEEDAVEGNDGEEADKVMRL